MHRTIAIATLAFLLDASARADVVQPEPTDCPPGSEGQTCHGGPYCGVAPPCSSSTACKGGMTCQLAHLCITQHDCWSWGGPNYVDSVKGTCAGGAACSVGTCKTYQVCMPTAPRPDASVPRPDAWRPLDARTSQPDSRSADAGTGVSSRGCKCGLEPAGGATDLPSGLLLAAAVVLAWRRRRSRG